MNQCNFTGNLAADVEQRFTKDGKAVSSFRIGVSCGYGDHKRTEWISCVSFGKTAEIAAQYLEKGSKVRVTTELKTDKWKDNDEKDRYSQTFIVNDLEFLTSKTDSAGRNEPPRDNFDHPSSTGSEVPF